MDIHVYIHDERSAQHVTHMLELLCNKVERILSQQETIMADLDQVIQDVTDESTAIDSVAALVAGLKQQLADALSGANIPPAVQAKIDAVFTGLEANKAKLANALATNTPATPAAPAPGL